MKQQKFTIGTVTYEIDRQYTGVNSVAALIRERLTQSPLGDSSVDEKSGTVL